VSASLGCLTVERGELHSVRKAIGENQLAYESRVKTYKRGLESFLTANTLVLVFFIVWWNQKAVGL
jgi:hypothetical protein